MPRELWGEFETPERPIEPIKTVPLGLKRAKLEEMQLMTPVAENKTITINVRNPIVTQTIEVMNQTEMLQTLIDTYSNKSEFTNYLVNPGELIPDVDFPPENSADFFNDDKFTKPIWFLPPVDTPFVRGVPKTYPEINTEVVRASLRKVVCGQLRVAGFTDALESAVNLFADSIEEFLYDFLRIIRTVIAMDDKKPITPELEIGTVERAYYCLTNKSIMQVHNHYKHDLLARNRSEVATFKEVLHEYDKLKKQSQNMQTEFKSDDMNEVLSEYNCDTTQQPAMVVQNRNETVYYDIDGATGTDRGALAANTDCVLVNNVQYAFAPNLQQQQQHQP